MIVEIKVGLVLVCCMFFAPYIEKVLFSFLPNADRFNLLRESIKNISDSRREYNVNYEYFVGKIRMLGYRHYPVYNCETKDVEFSKGMKIKCIPFIPKFHFLDSPQRFLSQKKTSRFISAVSLAVLGVLHVIGVPSIS